MKTHIPYKHLYPPLNIQVLLIIIAASIGCTKDYECNDVDEGRQHLLESSLSSFAYSGDETLIFKNSMDQELIFKPSSLIQSPIWLDRTQEVKEGACAGQMLIHSEQELIFVNFKSDSLPYTLIYQHGVNSRLIGSESIFWDNMIFSLYEGDSLPASWGITLSRVLDDRGNKEHITNPLLPDPVPQSISIGGKPFENVYSQTSSDGSQLYFNHELGLVGFKERNNPLWVLDRIE